MKKNYFILFLILLVFFSPLLLNDYSQAIIDDGNTTTDLEPTAAPQFILEEVG